MRGHQEEWVPGAGLGSRKCDALAREGEGEQNELKTVLPWALALVTIIAVILEGQHTVHCDVTV